MTAISGSGGSEGRGPEMIPQQMRFDDVSDDYRDFVDKFKPKKTTDDCYTPDAVYKAVAYWVESEYHLNAADFVRPFWPGGDYERFPYTDGCTVVDNPPFSIISRIVEFYEKHHIRYFLFAPYLTNFSIQAATCHIIMDQDIVYENGAKIATSFVTNLDNVLVRTAPDLAKACRQANDALQKKPQMPVYQYPMAVVTSTGVGYLGKHGINYWLHRDDTMFIRQLDAQKPMGKTIFGGGYLLSEPAAKAHDAAVREAETRETDKNDTPEKIVLELSERERDLQKQMGGGRVWQESTP